MRLRLHPGRHAYEYVWRKRSEVSNQLVDAIHFVEGVDHDAADTRPESLRDFDKSFVIAMEDNAVGIDASPERNVKFSTRGDINVETFFVNKLSHRSTKEGLASVSHTGSEGGDCFAHTVSEMLLVIDEHGCSEFGRYVEYINTTEREMTVRRDRGRIRKEEWGNRHAAILAGCVKFVELIGTDGEFPPLPSLGNDLVARHLRLGVYHFRRESLS